MSPRSIALIVCVLAASVFAPVAEAKTIRVKSEAGFAKAARKLRVSGGTIVLRPQLYRRLVIPPRRSTRPLADRRHGRRPRRGRRLRPHAARLVRPAQDRAGPGRRARRGEQLAPHPAPRPARVGCRLALLRLHPPARLAPRDHPPQQVHALRRPLLGVRELRDAVSLVAPHDHRGQPLLRLPRLRLRPRPLRHAPDDPAQPLRAGAAVPEDGQPPLRAQRPRPALRRTAAARRRATTSASTRQAARSSI